MVNHEITKSILSKINEKFWNWSITLTQNDTLQTNLNLERRVGREKFGIFAELISTWPVAHVLRAATNQSVAYKRLGQ